MVLFLVNMSIAWKVERNHSHYLYRILYLLILTRGGGGMYLHAGPGEEGTALSVNDLTKLEILLAWKPI